MGAQSVIMQLHTAVQLSPVPLLEELNHACHDCRKLTCRDAAWKPSGQEAAAAPKFCLSNGVTRCRCSLARLSLPFRSARSKRTAPEMAGTVMGTSPSALAIRLSLSASSGICTLGGAAGTSVRGCARGCWLPGGACTCISAAGRECRQCESCSKAEG